MCCIYYLFLVVDCKACLLLQMSDLISRLSDWSSISSPLAPLTPAQNDVIGQLGEETRSRPRPAHLPPPTSGHVTGGVASSVSTGSGDHGTSDQGHLWPAFRQMEEGGTSLGTCQQRGVCDQPRPASTAATVQLTSMVCGILQSDELC